MNEKILGKSVESTDIMNEIYVKQEDTLNVKTTKKIYMTKTNH